jgi:AcrR family transcriptional regulator
MIINSAAEIMSTEQPELVAPALGKQALLDAAAALMDERGVDNVSTHDIAAASGHRNRSAVQYHFGTRDAVIRAVIGRIMDPVNAERNAVLDHLEATGAALTPRTVIDVAVGPLARQLHTPEGRRYLRLCAQLINHPLFMTDARDAIAVNTSIARCTRHLTPAIAHLPSAVAAERGSQIAGFIIRACADQARLIDTGTPARPLLTVEDFTLNLTDTVLAILQAPTSIQPPP